MSTPSAAPAWRHARSWRRWGIIALALLGVASFQVIMATRGGTVSDLPGRRSGIGAGKPILIEFYSDL